MTPVRSGKTRFLGVRMEPETIERLEKLAKKMSQPGLELSLSDAVRMALLSGLETLEKKSKK